VTVLDRVKSSAELQDLLFDLCDFELSEVDVPSWIQLAMNHVAKPFGRDGAGGVFFTLQRQKGLNPAVMYASSEGQAGCLGASMDEFFAIIAAVPHWRDCLKFSASGSLAEMRRCDPLFAAEYREDIEDYDKKRKRLPKLLGVPAPKDPVFALHSAVQQVSEPVAFAPGEGIPFGPLFNTFTWKS
jgi:hypothetical protein